MQCVDNPPVLQKVNVQDLLQIRERMFSYTRQYTVFRPLELRQKRRRQKLKTFAKVRDTSRKLNTKLNQATLLLSSAYRSLLSPCAGYKHCLLYTSPSPRDATLSRMPSSA